MMKLFSVLLCLACLNPGSSYAMTAEECVVIVSSHQPVPKNGLYSSFPDSVKVVTRNACNATLDVRFCLETTKGGWDCGMKSNWEPNEKQDWFTAHGTRRYWVAARRSGTDEKLGRPD